MSKHLERDLEGLQRQVLTMGLAVEETLGQAIQAMQSRDTSLATEAIASDTAIDLQENQVAEECLKILALHQPVARDLRRIAAILAINTDLERMADLAVGIAERSLDLVTAPALAVPEKLQRMTDICTAMVRHSLDAFVQLDAAQARRVVRLDDEVDRYNAEIIDELVAIMHRDPALIRPALSMFTATRNLERIADHATNIAEDVVYLVEGEMIRHRGV